MSNHFTPENITELQPHEVFVFGSNLNVGQFVEVED